MISLVLKFLLSFYLLVEVVRLKRPLMIVGIKTFTEKLRNTVAELTF